jgi:hypothetical protein
MLPPWGSVGGFRVAPSGQILKPCLWQALCALAVAAAIAPPCELMLEAALALIAASTERRETIATAASIMVGGLRESAVAEASGHGTRRSAQFGRGRLDGIRERTSGAEQRGQETDRGGQHAAWWSSDLTGAWEALHSLQYTVDGQPKPPRGERARPPAVKQQCPFCPKTFNAKVDGTHSKHYENHVLNGNGCRSEPEAGRPPTALESVMGAPAVRMSGRVSGSAYGKKREELATRRAAYDQAKTKICSCENPEKCQKALGWSEDDS